MWAYHCRGFRDVASVSTGQAGTELGDGVPFVRPRGERPPKPSFGGSCLDLYGLLYIMIPLGLAVTRRPLSFGAPTKGP